MKLDGPFSPTLPNPASTEGNAGTVGTEKRRGTCGPTSPVLVRRRPGKGPLGGRDPVVRSIEGTKDLQSSLQTRQNAARNPYAKYMCKVFALL